MKLVRQGFELAGLVAIVLGLWQAWPPLGWIGGGSAAIMIAWCWAVLDYRSKP